MAETATLEPVPAIAARIVRLRGQNVIRDTDLAGLYGVPTKRLNEQAGRNPSRFPPGFRFQLSHQEAALLRSHFATSKAGRGGRRTPPWVYTEHGAIMAASVLSSRRAVQVSVFVVRAFVALRQALATRKELAARLEELERAVGKRSAAINSLMIAIRRLIEPPVSRHRRPIGFSPLLTPARAPRQPRRTRMRPA
jgi:hypothetical protein